MKELPTWEEINREKDQMNLSEEDMPALERFIYNNEPAASAPGFHNDKEFRGDLLAAVNEIQEEAIEACPWEAGELAHWDIVGMNHYHDQDGKQLFVAMSCKGMLIKEEGADQSDVFQRLEEKAKAVVDSAEQSGEGCEDQALKEYLVQKKVDRKTYMRRYMRKWRADEKRKKD